jgi:hypothetical protein
MAAFVFSYEGSSFALAGLVSGVLANRNTRFDIDEVIAFYEKNKGSLSTGKRAAEQAIESGENNLKWMNANYDVIFNWLKEQNSSSRY